MSLMRNVLALPCLLLPLMLAGCSIFPWSNDESDLAQGTESGPVSIDWKLTSENPATYLPASYDSSRSTDAFHGSWIVDHETGTRYFIPKGGTDGATASQITKDALARSSQPSTVGEVIDKTKVIGSSAVGKVGTGIDKITPSFGRKGKAESKGGDEP